MSPAQVHMTTTVTTDIDKIPFPKAKVFRGLEIIGNFPKHIRILVEGTAEIELRCAAYSVLHKKDPRYFSEIHTDEITLIVENVIYAIEKMIKHRFGITNEEKID